MFYYKLYGQVIKSDLEFKQLIPAEECDTDITFRKGDIPEEIIGTVNQFDVGDDYSWLSNNTCYLVIRNGKELIYQLKPGASEDYMRAFILGYGIAMLHHQRGSLAVHCSALSYNGSAVLISGRSGSGKSTLTSALLEEGLSLMADDMAVVNPNNEKAIAYPAFPFQKLCRDAALANGKDLSKLIYIDENKDKFLVPFRGEFDTAGKPVLAMFILMGEVDTDQVILEEVRGVAKIPTLGNNLFLNKMLKDNKFKGKCGQNSVTAAGKFPIFLVGRPAGNCPVEAVKEVVMEKISSI